MNTSLHNLISDNELPPSLKRPLVFGDLRQIEALRDLEEDIALMETEQAKVAAGNLKYFEVRISYSGEQYIKVLAVDEADARKKAREKASQIDAEIEIDFVNAREVHNERYKK